jgi:hypothetical protein
VPLSPSPRTSILLGAVLSLVGTVVCQTQVFSAFNGPVDWGRMDAAHARLPDAESPPYQLIAPWAAPSRTAGTLLVSEDLRRRSDNDTPLRECYGEKSLTYDLAERDRLPQVQDVPSSKVSAGWGPPAFKYPSVVVPEGCDPVKWKRLRVVAVANRYIGLPYRHHHVPGWSGSGEGPGLDCSNFTSWVYNYGLGIIFPSEIQAQADGPRAPGRRLKDGESFEPGDLLFIMKKDYSRVSHAVIFVDKDHITDSHRSGVQVRAFQGWYKSHLSHARRIIE